MDRDYEMMIAAQAYEGRSASNSIKGGLLSAGGVSKEPELAQAINEVHALRKAIEETRAALTDFTDRMLIGERMVNDAESADRSVPSFNNGVTGQLRRAINDAETAARDAMSLAHKLRHIG